METIVIDKEVFDTMLKQIENLSCSLESLRKKIQDKSLFEWIDSQEVCAILKISLKTLQSYRETGKISYTQINRKIYYKVDDIKKKLIQTRI